jgi:FlaG/FlaF family flagellin (archaellin)
LHPNWGTGRDKPTGNKKGVKKMKKVRKITRDKKGIDTILAALLMVVIVVVAAVMVYAWATGLLGTLLVNPNNKVGNEAINMETYGWNPNGANTYNVTLNLRNTGTSAITLASYYVKDNNGNQWANLAWQTNGPDIPAAIAPNAVKSVMITIGNGGAPGGPGGYCGSSCSLSGSGFTTFQSGYSYTIVVVTSRNNQFSFTVTR